MLANDGRSGSGQSKHDASGKPKEVSSLEESVVRMRHGITGNGHSAATYERMPVSESVYRQLLRLELRALQKTGRLQQMLEKKPR